MAILWSLSTYYSAQYYKTNNKLQTVQNELKISQENYQFEAEKAIGLSEALGKTRATILDLKSEEYEFIYLGDFKTTYYCDERRSHICGGNGVTASGKPTQVGKTIAVDPTVIPLGTTVYIEGVGFMEAQDTGGAVIGNHIDILVEDHYTAEQLGTQYNGVWIFAKKS